MRPDGTLARRQKAHRRRALRPLVADALASAHGRGETRGADPGEPEPGQAHRRGQAGGSSNAGAFTVASGATLDFGGGTFTITGGPFTVGGLVEVTGGAPALGASNETVGVFMQQNSVIDGTGALTISGAATFNCVAVQTGNGTTLPQGVTTLAGILDVDGGRTFENAGTFNWTSG